MEEQRNTDTPQPATANTGTSTDAFGAPQFGEGSDDNLSVEDAFFSSTESDNQPAPEQGQPAENLGNNTPEAPYEAKNDDKRFEYWQSQAAKKENELNAFKKEVAAAIQAQRAQQPQQQPQGQPEQKEFPPPPPKPEKPRGFSREEAWTDPNSASAQYLDAMDDWNDNINQYRDLRSQYDVAVIRERMENQERAKRAQEIQRQEWARDNAKKQEVYEHVQGHYGLDPKSAQEFVNTMSNPNSINLDNLVQLYKMNKGGGQPPISQGPSDAFQQTKNAQQVPSPMGVMPGQGSQPNRSDADAIMDDLINTHNSKNPWN